jgi:prepilin-type N-terminal cleavage/methylation domain-containing protein
MHYNGNEVYTKKILTRRFSNMKNAKKAFTLVELLVVIAIIAILFVVLISKVNFATDKAKESGVQTDFRSFQMAMHTVATEQQGFTSDLDELTIQLNRNLDRKLHVSVNGSEMMSAGKDPWGTNYKLTYSEPADTRGEVTVVSAGPDMKFNTEDDLTLSSKYAITENGSEIIFDTNTGMNIEGKPADNGNNSDGNDSGTEDQEVYDLVAGLYNSGTLTNYNGGLITKEEAASELIATWEELINNDSISVDDKKLTSAKVDGDLVISNEIGIIGENACSGINTLTAVYLPESIIEIQEYAFDGCEGLTEIIIPDSVTTIGNYAFDWCSGLKQVTIGSGVRNMGAGAFSWCYTLKKVIIKEGLTSISNYMFNGCSALNDIELPSTIVTIEDYAFQEAGMSTLIIPEGVTHIGDDVFLCCYNLQTLSIPDSIQYIGDFVESLEFYNLSLNEYDNAFYLGNENNPYVYLVKGNTNATSITIHSDVKVVNVSAFMNCYSLQYNEFRYGKYLGTEENPYLVLCQVKDEIADLFINEQTKYLHHGACHGSWSLMKIAIPKSVIVIHESSFPQMTNEIYYAGTEEQWNNIQVNGDYTMTYPDQFSETTFYYNCDNSDWQDSLITLSAGLYAAGTIDDYYNGRISILDAQLNMIKSWSELLDNNSITVNNNEINTVSTSLSGDLIIGEGITDLSYSSFNNCSNLTKIVLPETITGLSASAFEGCTNLTYNEYDNGCYIGTYSNPYMIFVKAKSLDIASIVIHEDTIFACNSGLMDCSNITSITWPAKLKSIPSYFFKNCTSLTSIELHEDITNIEQDAFNGCTALTSITIPEGIKNINWGLFDGCTSLKTVNLPSTITGIDYYAFSNCTSLENINIPDGITYIGEGAFSNCTSLSFAEYDNGYYLGNENNPYVIFMKPTSTTVTSITIHDDAVAIEPSAFYGCTAVTTLDLGDGIKSVEMYTLSSLTNLKNVTIGKGLTSVGYGMFAGCKNLESIILPENVKSVDNDAFIRCSGLTTVTMNGVESIYLGGFQDCTSLKTVIISNSIKLIDSGAFYGCTGITDVYFMGTEEEWNAIEIYGNENLLNANIHFNYRGE